MASHLSHDEFFNGLIELFNHRKGKDHGAIYLVQKRLTYDNDDSFTSPTSEAPFPDTQPSRPLPVLIRATNGKSARSKSDKVKLSTVVQPDDLEQFFSRYADICKTGMAALKPRDKSKKKAKAKKKRTAAPTSS